MPESWGLGHARIGISGLSIFLCEHRMRDDAVEEAIPRISDYSQLRTIGLYNSVDIGNLPLY